MKLYLTKEEKDKIKNLGLLKVSQVAYFLDVNRQTVINWIKKGALKANYLKFYNRKTYLIKAEELIRFIKEIPKGFYGIW
ncbi:MAG: helix-turn-helix domain-containing protein [candidate division WOR-3 bacterium]